MRVNLPLFVVGASVLGVAIWQRQALLNAAGIDYDAEGDYVSFAGDYVADKVNEIVSRVVSLVTRGFRNNNPLNIRVGQNWQGERAQQTDGVFEEFDAPEYGFRAACRVLDNYRTKYGLRTVADIVGRWAPTHENPTESYAAYVCEKMSVYPTQQIDTADAFVMFKLLDAMTRFENNGLNPYPDNIIYGGIQLARGASGVTYV